MKFKLSHMAFSAIFTLILEMGHLFIKILIKEMPMSFDTFLLAISFYNVTFFFGILWLIITVILFALVIFSEEKTCSKGGRRRTHRRARRRTR